MGGCASVCVGEEEVKQAAGSVHVDDVVREPGEKPRHGKVRGVREPGAVVCVCVCMSLSE